MGAIFDNTTDPGRPEHVEDFPEKWELLWAARDSNSNFGKVPPDPLQNGAIRGGLGFLSLTWLPRLDGGGKEKISYHV